MVVLFPFGLPVAAVLQRTLANPLQIVSSTLFCELLDLPCVGASGLLFAFFSALSAVYRPRIVIALAAGLGGLCWAVGGKAVRTTLAAVGSTQGGDVPAEPLGRHPYNGPDLP